MRHEAPATITRINAFDAPHSVTLSIQDWLGIQTHLGFAAHNNKAHGFSATAEVIDELLERLRPQTMTAIEAAAEIEDAAAVGA